MQTIRTGAAPISERRRCFPLVVRRLSVATGSVRVERNGTFIRVNGERVLKHGDYVFLGQQLLRVEIV